jgi:hypothetical protein
MQRQQVKGTGVRQPSLPEKDPNFYLMDSTPSSAQPSSTGHHENVKIQSIIHAAAPSISTALTSLPGMLMPFSLPSQQQTTSTANIPYSSSNNTFSSSHADLGGASFPMQLLPDQGSTTNMGPLPPPNYLHALLASIRTANQNNFLGQTDQSPVNWAASMPPPQPQQPQQQQQQQQFHFAMPEYSHTATLTSNDHGSSARRNSKLGSLLSFGYGDDVLEEIDTANHMIQMLDDQGQTDQLHEELKHQESDETFEAALRILGENPHHGV